MRYLSDLDPNNLTVELINQILFKLDYKIKEASDCALVLGSSKAHLYKMPEAAALYQSGLIKKICVSGGRYLKENIKESDYMYHSALNHAVKATDILIEDQAMYTADNFIKSKEILIDNFGTDCKITLITTHYHMRRALALAKEHLPKSMTIIPYYVNDQNTRKENWFDNEGGYKRCLKEVKKIINYIQLGYIKDDLI
jgi:uncharacterized SAM-binding protein YcdF (DUF218 family)